MWADFEAFVDRFGGLCWAMLTCAESKDPKNGKSNKTQDILRVGGLSWGAILEHLGSMLADLGGYIVSA